jgi:hypothetical protein
VVNFEIEKKSNDLYLGTKEVVRPSPADRRRASANNGNMQTPPSRKGGRPPAVERPPRASPRGSCLPQAVGSRGRKRATASPARARGKWRWRGRAWGRRPPCSIRSAQPDRRPAPRAVRRHIQLQPHAARRPPPRASSTSIDVEVDAAGSRPPSTRPTLHAAEIVLLDPPRLAPPQAWIPPAVDLEVAAGLGRSDADKWALAGCAWTLVGRGPRAPLLRRLPSTCSIASPSTCSVASQISPVVVEEPLAKSRVAERGAGGRWLGCSIPGDARRTGLAAFCSRFCGSCWSRYSVACSIHWRQVLSHLISSHLYAFDNRSNLRCLNWSSWLEGADVTEVCQQATAQDAGKRGLWPSPHLMRERGQTCTP